MPSTVQRRAQTFEYDILESLDWMVRYTKGAYGKTIRRRMSFGRKIGTHPGVAQGFDLLHMSSLAKILVECKTLRMPADGDVTGYRGRFYVERNLKRAQVTWFIEYALGFGLVPIYAFMISREGSTDRDAFLLDAETVARSLLAYSYVGYKQMDERGLAMPRIHVNDSERGKRLHLYEIYDVKLHEMIEKFKIEQSGKDSAVRAWLMEAGTHGELPMNCKRFLDGGKNPWQGGGK